MVAYAASAKHLSMMPTIYACEGAVSKLLLGQLAALTCLENEPAWNSVQLGAAWAGREHLLVVEQQGQAVGYMVAAHVLDQADIHTVLVDIRQRGQGLAKALLQSMIQRLREQGVEQVFLEVRQGNLAAQALYANQGFAVTGSRNNYYANKDGSKENAIMMMASL